MLDGQPDMFGYAPRADWPFGSLEPHAYSLIVADPPWAFLTRSEKGKKKSADMHYRTMTLDDIKALPVADLAAPDCVLWLWATAPMLDVQMEVLKCWSFRYVSSAVWKKTTTSGKTCFGTGYVCRNAHEIILCASRGNPKYVSRSVRSVIEGGDVITDVRREHSRKPDSAYAAARALVPYGRAVELFAREARPGFEAWGNEATKFDEAAA